MKRERFLIVVGLSAALVVGVVEAQIGEIQRVEQTSSYDSTDWKQVTAPCPAGTIAFGGGADLDTNLSIIVHQSMPVGNPPTSWTAVAQERVPTGASWSLTTWALCATIAGYELVEATTPFDSSPSKAAFAFCPSGKMPIGGGGGIFFFSPSLALTTLSPFSTGWQAVATESPSTSANWLVNVKVSCAPGLDIETYQGYTLNGAESFDDLLLSCPVPRTAVGGGAILQNGWIASSRPYGSGGWYLASRRLAGGSGSLWNQGVTVQCYLP